MLEMGFVVALGLLVTLSKLSWPWKLRILSSPVFMDVLVFLGLLAIHWGTFSGVMVATIGALVCSMVLQAGRFLFGFYADGQYVPGKFNVSHRLN